MKTNVYIDGFNFYYRSVKGTPNKWLDFSKLAGFLLGTSHTVNRIRYYTARVKPLPGNPDAPVRQAVYLRALNTLPNLSISYGHFLLSRPMMRLAHPPPGGPDTVEVLKFSEKGSDVNLATHLLLDAFDGDCEAALILSTDSDLLEPIRIVRSRFGLKVGVVKLPRGHSAELMKEADFVRRVRPSVLAISQFPTAMKDATGDFNKPATW